LAKPTAVIPLCAASVRASLPVSLNIVMTFGPHHAVEVWLWVKPA
jgi:hypothetical protein